MWLTAHLMYTVSAFNQTIALLMQYLIHLAINSLITTLCFTFLFLLSWSNRALQLAHNFRMARTVRSRRQESRCVCTSLIKNGREEVRKVLPPGAKPNILCVELGEIWVKETHSHTHTHTGLSSPWKPKDYRNLFVFFLDFQKISFCTIYYLSAHGDLNFDLILY